MDHACHSQTVFDFRVFDRMSSHESHACLFHFRKPSEKDVFQMEGERVLMGTLPNSCR